MADPGNVGDLAEQVMTTTISAFCSDECEPAEQSTSNVVSSSSSSSTSSSSSSSSSSSTGSSPAEIDDAVVPASPATQSPPTMSNPSPKTTPSSATRSASGRNERTRLHPQDFKFGRMLGEGAYAKVLQATRISTGREYAVKIVDKMFIQKHKKIDCVMNERKVLSTLNHPNIIKLHFTFQDAYSLYYVLELAERGELYAFIEKMGQFDIPTSRFFIAEIIATLEYLHAKGVTHRDLKPENILISASRHIKITDFGTSKLISDQPSDDEAPRKNSFVGTAEYVSPEVLNDKPASSNADLWALGCIIYQMLLGSCPFRGESEYLTFQKILARDLHFPDDFDSTAQDLIEGLLQFDPVDRIGANQNYQQLKDHPFFNGFDWADLQNMTPPELPDPDLSDEESDTEETTETPTDENEIKGDPDYRHSQWNQFLLDDENIIFTAYISKRRGIFAKKRQLILTDMPRFVYVDTKRMEVKGEIKWCSSLWAEWKTAQQFYIHIPTRSYYMVGLSCSARKWVDEITKVKKKVDAQATIKQLPSLP